MPEAFTALFSVLVNYLEELKKRGQVINPLVEITPEKTAEFMSKAEFEINPYYASQVKLAREGFLRSLGYTRDEILSQEQDAERKYRSSVRQLGEQLAETGFAQSGARQLGEQELAEQTQRDLERARRKAEFDIGSEAREFAQKYGTEQLPAETITETPRVLPSQLSFERTGRTLPLYSLSPDVYQGLIGEQEFQRRGNVGTRASQLEEAFRTKEQLKQQRQLTL